MVRMYDVGSQRSFKNAMSYWLGQVRQLCRDGVPVVLVGSKADLAETVKGYRAVEEPVAAALAPSRSSPTD